MSDLEILKKRLTSLGMCVCVCVYVCVYVLCVYVLCVCVCLLYTMTLELTFFVGHKTYTHNSITQTFCVCVCVCVCPICNDSRADFLKIFINSSFSILLNLLCSMTIKLTSENLDQYERFISNVDGLLGQVLEKVLFRVMSHIMLKHAATHCNKLQHTVTHCNTGC